MQSLIMAVGECLVHIRKAFFDSYRPERHYMRGPGPKCHAKLAGLMAETAVATPSTSADFATLHG